jgi:hypothetical protein
MKPVGEHLKYIVFAGQSPIACLDWSSAARHIGDGKIFLDILLAKTISADLGI